jgi:hypothetical protein
MKTFLFMLSVAGIVTAGAIGTTALIKWGQKRLANGTTTT